MRIVIFFLCLCSLVLKGNTHMFAALQQQGNNCTQHQHRGKHHHHSNSANTNRDNSFFADSNTEAEEEYVADDDDHDQDTNNISAVKFRLQARSHATHAYPAYPDILNYLCLHYKAAPAVYLPASDKIIFQGVFRI